MAGFLGFLNYQKEGPGIEKDAPKKKTFIVFFETFFRNFWKFTSINLVFSAISLPVLTNGLAAAGITNVTRNIARDRHSFGLSDFFETIKKNLKQSLCVGTINALITALLAFCLFFYFRSGGAIGTIGLGITIALTFVFFVMGYYIWTLMITFNFTIKQLYANSFKFVFVNIGKNLLCTLCILSVYGIYIAVLMLFPTYFVLMMELMIAMFTLPAFRYLLIQYFTFPAIKKYVIDPYYREHPDADVEKRRDLGLDVENQSKNDTDGPDI